MANIEASWQAVLKEEFEKPYMAELRAFLKSEQDKGIVTFPKNADIFNAFNHTPFDQVKVVILGQDPYHGVGQAHGLSFSVQKGVPIPPSLKNIYKELADEFPDFKMPISGDLTAWADQGILLLNATLTVRAHEAASHQNRGWEIFTDQVISSLSEKREGIVFLLWGAYARKKKALINTAKHRVLEAPHPSPFSVHTGFFGCGHFKQTNEILESKGLNPIDWKIV